MKQEDMLKEMLKRIALIKKDHREIMSIQTKLFSEMCHKLNNVGVFLWQIVDIKKSSAKNKRN